MVKPLRWPGHIHMPKSLSEVPWVLSFFPLSFFLLLFFSAESSKIIYLMSQPLSETSSFGTGKASELIG